MLSYASVKLAAKEAVTVKQTFYFKIQVQTVQFSKNDLHVGTCKRHNLLKLY